MVIFGGFMDLTRELKDLYLFDFHTQEWIKIFEENKDHAALTPPYIDRLGLNASAGPSRNLGNSS